MPDMLKNEKIYHSIDIIEKQNYNKEKTDVSNRYKNR